MDIDKLVVETYGGGGGKFFAAFEQESVISYSWKCTLCGKIVSPKRGKQTSRWMEKLYDHWRYAHKTKFTLFAIVGAGDVANWRMNWGKDGQYWVGSQIN